MLDIIFHRRVGWASGILGGIALLFCVGYVGVLSYSDRNPVTEQSCRDAFKTNSAIKATTADENGVLRIVGVWPVSTTIDRRICLPVAGVSPSANEERLKQTLADRQRDARSRRADYDRAVNEASAATKIAAEAKALADQAEPSQAEDLRARAAKARSAADAKDQIEADLQKKDKAAADELATVEAAFTKGLPPVDLTLFLNGRRASDLTFKARAVSDIQYAIYDLSIPADASSTGAKFFRELLAGGTDWGVKTLTVGASRVASDNQEAEVGEEIKVIVYNPVVFGIGVFAMLTLSLAFCVLARYSTLLRDNGKTLLGTAQARLAAANALLAAKPGDPAFTAAVNRETNRVTSLTGTPAANEPGGPYSLGRTQMAMWLVLTVAGFIFIWLTLGQFLNVITAQVLILLGINGATGLAAVQLNDPADASETKSFFSDLLNDGDGPKLQRIQVLAWTAILAVIFVWNVVANFYFVPFDNNLLLLMGIANAMYVGFKPNEKAAQ